MHFNRPLRRQLLRTSAQASGHAAFRGRRTHDAQVLQSTPEPKTPVPSAKELYEDIYTVPNVLTISRIFACPVIGYYVVQGDFVIASSLLFYAGVSDLVRAHLLWHQLLMLSRAQIDGWYARKYNKGTVLGTILDPAADKLLMTTLTITLAIRGLLPSAPFSSELLCLPETAHSLARGTHHRS